MKILLAGFLAFSVWTAISIHWYVCKIKQLCAQQEQPAKADSKTLPESTSYSFFVLDGADTVARFAEPVYAIRDKGAIHLPLSTAGLYDSIVAYLAGRPDKMIVIRSLDDPRESPPASDDDLGVLRGDLIRLGLRQKGLEPGRVEIETGSAQLNFRGDRSGNAIELVVVDLVRDPGPFTINFESDASSPQATPDLPVYVTRLRNFLENHPEKAVLVTGFTDNSGNAAYNRTLGLRRAEAVKQMLADSGITPVRLRTESGGEDNPVASNDTETGKAENRRVIIRIQ